jgi:diguanylate cyclase (GGDEF)-like protein
MSLRIPKHLSIVERLLMVLTVLTIAIMAWQYWGMNLSLVITPDSGHKIWAMGDAADKGASIAKLHKDTAYNMECQIKNQIQFPYCSLYIQLSPNHQGLDLTVYQQLLITVKQTGSIRDSISLYLKDLKNEIDIAGLSNQTSVNQLALNPAETFTEYVLPLKRFYVPSWWVYHSRLPHETPGPNLSDINYLVINTGDNHNEREVNISISRIEFRGKWIDADELYKMLLVVWISIFGGFYLVLFIKLQIESNEEKNHRRELEEINNALDNKRKQLESRAIYDSGTGILNRRGVIDRLQDLFQQTPQGQAYSIALVSIENYRTIEARLKEDCADELAAYVALQFAGYMAQKITIARWGKNELLALMDISDPQVAENKIQQFINDNHIMKFRDSYIVQTSIGVVVTPPQPTEAVIALIEQASATAKHSAGKIHIIIHQPAVENQ